MSCPVTLRPVVESDLPTLFAHQEDPVVRAMGVVPYRDHDAFFAKWKEVLTDDSVINRSIWVGDELVGNIACFLRDGVREVGYIIGREFWGKGIGSAAIAAFLPLLSAFARPITARVVKHNYASLRVLQKNGFLITAEIVVTDDQGRNIPEYLLTLCEEGNP